MLSALLTDRANLDLTMRSATCTTLLCYQYFVQLQRIVVNNIHNYLQLFDFILNKVRERLCFDLKGSISIASSDFVDLLDCIISTSITSSDHHHHHHHHHYYYYIGLCIQSLPLHSRGGSERLGQTVWRGSRQLLKKSRCDIN